MGTFLGAGPVLRRRVAALAALIALVWLLAACSSGAEDSSAGSAAYDQAGPVAADGGMADAGVEDAADTASLTVAEDRALIITGSMYMTVEDPIAAADRAEDIVRDVGGRIDARRETAPTEYDGGSADLRLRIPASELDSAVDRLRELGTVDEYTTDSADVTQEVTDLEARISTLRASTARIEGLLTEANEIADIIVLEDELASRQAELESLEARQRGLDDQVAMSTIGLSLTTEPVVMVDDAPRSFWSGLQSGWDGLVSFVSGALVVAGVLLPWLAAAAVLLGLAWLTVRRARARRARAVAAAPVAPAAAATTASSPDGD